MVKRLVFLVNIKTYVNIKHLISGSSARKPFQQEPNINITSGSLVYFLCLRRCNIVIDSCHKPRLVLFQSSGCRNLLFTLSVFTTFLFNSFLLLGMTLSFHFYFRCLQQVFFYVFHFDLIFHLHHHIVFMKNNVFLYIIVYYFLGIEICYKKSP
uniref:Uncharacterized protein n=1 Tax=Cacopsylla melanoneura TaxID=428564 RepID=A0A8D9ANS2_9HEMI